MRVFVVCFALVLAGCSASPAIPVGSDLYTGGETGIAQPLPPGGVVGVGTVTTQNVGDQPIKILSARFLHVDPDVVPLGFTGVLYRGGVPITDLRYPFEGAVPLEELPELPPRASEPQVVISFGLQVKPGGRGRVLGVAVRYRRGVQVFEQVFKQQFFVCETPTLEVDCPGISMDYETLFGPGSFEEELEKARARLKKAKDGR